MTTAGQFPGESFVNSLYGATFSVAFAFGPVFQIKTRTELFLSLSVLFLATSYALLLYQSAATISQLGLGAGLRQIGWPICAKLIALISLFFLVTNFPEFSPKEPAFGIPSDLYRWFLILLLILWSATIICVTAIASAGNSEHE